MHSRICIIGAGAIGTLLGVSLSGRQADVTMLVRPSNPPRPAAPDWLRLRRDGTDIQARPRFTSEPAELGVQDLVFIAVKSHDVPGLTASVRHLVGPDTTVVTTMNGLPWWFFPAQVACRGESEPVGLAPGTLDDLIDERQIVGALLFTNCSRLADGTVQWHSGRSAVVGAAAPSLGQAHADRVIDLLTQAGLEVTGSTSIRAALWDKLIGNAILNPVSALTRRTIGDINADPLLRGFVVDAMGEIEALGQRIGFAPHRTPQERLMSLAKLSACRTSMLYDVLADRPTEVHALLGPLLREADRFGLSMRMTAALLALTQALPTAMPG